MAKMTKIIVYELNEVPWKVMDFYLEQRPNSHCAKFMEKCAKITTHTEDSGELHPWSTWPTMHRGVTNDVHNIRFINQDLSCAGASPPLWEILEQSQKTVGICGSLQSYPPLDLDNVLFHIPDTFSTAADTKPAKYSAFQKFNIRLTSENKAVAGKLSFSNLLASVKLFKSGVRLSTARTLAKHLLNERLNNKYKTRRAVMQAYVAFDVLMDALSRNKPDYVSFFSNHVAGMMHRYWKHAFPEDFSDRVDDSEHSQFHSGSILAAMDIFDDQLGTLVRFSEMYGYDLIVASSMGQQAIERGEYVPELKLENEVLLAKQLGLKSSFEIAPAMQPDVSFKFNDSSGLKEFKTLFPMLRDVDGNQVFVQRYSEQGLTLNLSVRSSKAVVESEYLKFGEKEIHISDLGLSIVRRDQGTGYHQPNGLLLWKGGAQPRIYDRRTIDSRQYAPSLLTALGVHRPDYMMSAIS